MAKDICSVLSRALDDFDQMRTREGERLKEDILSRAAAIEEKVSLVEKRSPQTVANTIGSKCGDIEIAGHVVDIKAEIEKIREQVQNIE